MSAPSDSVKDRWLRENWQKLNYAVPLLPDIGHEVDGVQVTRVDRLKGEYWLEDGRKVVMPRLLG